MSSELKPCPICGEAKHIRLRPIRDGHVVRCCNIECGCSGGAGYNGPGDPGGRKRAAELWNTRNNREEELERTIESLAQIIVDLEQGNTRAALKSTNGEPNAN